GDKVVVSKLNGEELEYPRIATVSDVGNTWFEIHEVINGDNIVMKDSSVDYWSIAESSDEGFLVEDVDATTSTHQVGQHDKVDCGGFVEVGEVVETDVSDAGEYEFKVKSETSSTTYKLNQVDSVEAYKGDEDKIMPNYIELASGGMTFSEFAGEDI